MRKKRKAITHEQFFRLCEEMRNHREQIVDCASPKEVVEVIKGHIDFDPAIDSINSALAAVNIQPNYRSRKRTGGAGAKRRADAFCRAIVGLYQKLGEQVPADLVAEANALGMDVAQPPVKPAVNGQKPIPVADVKQPEFTRIINR